MKRVLFFSSVKSKDLFYTQKFYSTDIKILEDLGCTVILSNKISDSFFFWRYDFVFAYFYRKSFFVGLIARLFGKGAYFTGGIDDLAKEYASSMRYFVQKFFMRLCYFVSSSCIIVSKADMKNVERVVHNQKKLSYSEHTIEVGNFILKGSNKDNLFVTIAWMGSINNVKRKGVDRALEIFAFLKQKPLYSDFKFLIIGKEGEGTTYLRELISRYHLEDSVILTGEISESKKIEYLKRSRYYFQLSIYEGFGLAALEALAAKNIVIHSSKGGLANPIFSSGICFDIKNDWKDETCKLLNSLVSYDAVKLDELTQYICQYYNNNRRKNDFLKIISELKS